MGLLPGVLFRASFTGYLPEGIFGRFLGAGVWSFLCQVVGLGFTGLGLKRNSTLGVLALGALGRLPEVRRLRQPLPKHAGSLPQFPKAHVS